ncbi:hypothetical protein E4T25_04355 [Photobacterium damselae subsp. piscicida]|uniref:hypothetical protein n=1 Tax=Photobacterium damselae TaxID=38293 RepID=UPI00107620BE|nr:hypothetical protein [Photobacterium damselae]TFZ62433.1 hypothetical protein E4T25_04355 [Photobacterium damselae subsp. piscicida]
MKSNSESNKTPIIKLHNIFPLGIIDEPELTPEELEELETGGIRFTPKFLNLIKQMAEEDKGEKDR